MGQRSRRHSPGEERCEMRRSVRTAIITVLTAAAAGAVAAIVVRDQFHRYRRDLFSPRPYRRLVALRHIGRESASIDTIRLLRDFIRWEPRRGLRSRAQAIVDRMIADAAALEREARAPLV